MSPTAPAIDPRRLRRAFGTFATGVTITTTIDGDGAPAGFTANSFTSVSLDPPLLLVCIAETANTFAAFRGAGRFAVNVLSATQRALSTTFATQGADRFAGVAWRSEKTGAPVIDGGVAWFDCTTERLIDAGDHVIILGRVVDFDHAAGAPLAYCRGGYVRLDHDGAAIGAPAGAVRVSAIVERGGAILLNVDGEEGELPAAAAFGPSERVDSLQGMLKAAGVAAELSYLFASYDDGPVHHVVYRSILPPSDVVPSAGWRFVPFAEIDSAKFPPSQASLLRLYREEREAHAYGRYVGDAISFAGADRS
jgi:flavin reductase (DIM6/NTAB) family NADH-FMN oxidoreductase RutF